MTRRVPPPRKYLVAKCCADCGDPFKGDPSDLRCARCEDRNESLRQRGAIALNILLGRTDP